MEYLNRIQSIQKAMLQKNCEAFLVSNLKDILYLTGIALSSGRVLITLNESFLIVDGRYVESCEKKSPIPVVLSEKDALWRLLGPIKTLGIDSEAISYQAYIDFESECNERAIALVPVKGLTQLLRSRKSHDEIRLLRQAAELGSQGFDYVLSQIKEGISEEELADRLAGFWKSQGASGFSFSPIIAFGPSSSMPHYRAGKNRLQKNDIILIDIGVELNQYNSDMTRVVFFGDVKQELEKVHSIVYKALHGALALCRPGTLVKDLDKAARDIIASAGYGAYFTHSLGHGVGIEIHEFPTLRQDSVYGDCALSEGMVVTIEPGIYLPGVGGVRLEDMIVINKDGYENLTNRGYTYRLHV